MRRIAVIADIHGNLPALEAVLDDISRAKIEEILVAGDLVGRGPEGSAVVARIRSLGLPTIGGNHEDYVLAARHGELPSAWHDTDVWDAARFMASELEAEHADYLAALPFSLAREGFLLVHGTPASNRDGIGPWTEDTEIRHHLQAVAEPMLVCAHTHRPLIRRFGPRCVVNVGSVGLPFNRDHRAQYGVLEQDVKGWKPQLRQVPYDIERILEIYQTSGFLEQGGVTAKLLRLEIQHAAPVLVPFLTWAEATGTPPDSSRLGAFFDIYTPGAPLRLFFQYLQALGPSS